MDGQNLARPLHVSLQQTRHPLFDIGKGINLAKKRVYEWPKSRTTQTLMDVYLKDEKPGFVVETKWA